MSRPAARALLALSVLGLAALAPVRAAAQPADDAKIRVPLDLLIHGKGQVADHVFVITGCGSAEGKHQIALAAPSRPVRCDVTGPLSVYAIPKASVAPLEAMVAKDAGSSNEIAEAKPLLAAATACGSIEETTNVDRDKQITLLTAHYALTKTKTDCTIKKLGNTVPQTPELRHPPKPPAPSAEPSAEPPSDPPAAAAAKKGGCSCGGCVAAGRSGSDAAAASAGVAGALLVLAARRRRRR
jgi:hypothetical protein